VASPTNPTISHAREGYNGRLTVSRYGSFLVRVMSLDTSVKIIASDEEAARRRAFYPFITVGSSFDMVIVHTGWEDREAFNKWVRGYAERVTNNESIGGTMLIEVPVRRFSRIAVPEFALTYGERLGDISYTTSMSFIGAKEPASAIGTNNVAGDSYVKSARIGQATSKYFYPSGTQVAGAASLEGTIFDSDWKSPLAAGGAGTPGFSGEAGTDSSFSNQMGSGSGYSTDYSNKPMVD
jgi:hypothetical protein